MNLIAKIDEKDIPRAPRIAADQKSSPISEGRYSSPPIRSPYFCCMGSNIVTYPWDLIRLAKKNPPKDNENSIHFIHLFESVIK